MLRIKKGFSDQLLQIALLLSLIGYDRLWPTFGVWPSTPLAEVEVGPLDHWGRNDSYSYGFGPSTQIHPKSVGRYLNQHWLLNELLSLGRYGDLYPSNFEAYFNVDGDENGRDDQTQEACGQVAVKTEPKENDCEDDDAVDVFDTDIGEEVFMLAPEDAELVESLWKVDLDVSTASMAESRGVTPLQFGGDIGEFLQLPGDEPPFRNYTLGSTAASPANRRWFLPPVERNGNDSLGSSTNQSSNAQKFDGNAWEVDRFLVDLRTAGENRLKRPRPDNDTETSDLDTDGLADIKFELSGYDNAVSPNLTSEFQLKDFPWHEPSFKFNFTDYEAIAEMMQCYSHPPPSRHLPGRMGYARTGSSMEQRGWQDLAACNPMLAFPGEGQHHQHHYGQHPSGAFGYAPGPSMYHHHHHHHHSDTNNTAGSVLLQNVSLCAPPPPSLQPPPPPPPPTTSINMQAAGAGSLLHVASSSSSHYHHHSSSVGVSTNCNLSSAVATSLHLAGSSSEQSAAFKTEPHQHEMMYPYQNHNSEMTPSSDGLLSSILNDDDLQLMDPSAMGADGGMYPVRLMDTASSSVPCNGAMQGATTMVQNSNAGGDSDSAVSSMGSERVPSLSSDTEWMETNSDSGHTEGYSAHPHQQEYGKIRWLDNYLYSGNRGHPSAPQKKYQLYGRRLTDSVQGTPSNATETARSNHVNLVPDSLNLPYDMSVREGIPVPGSSQYTRHMAGCSRVLTPDHHVALNHTYAMPIEGPRTPRNKLKSNKRSEEEQLTRDEKRARNLNIPISVDDIINLPMDEFNERLSKYDLTESQLTLIRDIRRRGKNKVAAQNCRKRKLDQILSLADEVKQMKDRKFNLLQEREYLMTERMRVKTKYDLLYNHIFASLRDTDGNPYSPYTHTLREQPDGSVSIVPRNNGTQTDRNPRSKQHKDK